MIDPIMRLDVAITRLKEIRDELTNMDFTLRPEVRHSNIEIPIELPSKKYASNLNEDSLSSSSHQKLDIHIKITI